jgi:hypothetical protein
VENDIASVCIFECILPILRSLIIAFFCWCSCSLCAANTNDTATVVKTADTGNILKGLNLKKVPSIDTLYKVAKKYMGRWHYLFLAIKIEESGNNGHYSWLSTKHFNLCGMRYPKSRRTYAIGSTNTNYAIYRNWFECILDFKIYMDNIEQKFKDKNHRLPKDDIEMIHFMFNTFNHFAKWKKDMLILIKYVKKKYH